MPNKLPLVLLTIYFVVRSLILLLDQRAEIKIFDVGQGDAILIKTSQGKLILIDGGPDFEVDWHLQDQLLINSCKIELIILTHPHQDHLRGLNRLLKRCRIKYVLFDNFEYGSREYQEWLENVKNLDVLNFSSGDILKIDELNLVILWPPANGYQNKNINSTSIVILLDSGDFEALLSGDLETDVSGEIDYGLINRYLDGRLELYKAGHHGSVNGFHEALLNKLKPELCVISVGEGNRYGHPHQKVLDALNRLGCRVKRTDQDGNIEVLIN